MNLIIKNFDTAKLIILTLLVASFPFHYHLSSVFIILCTIMCILKFYLCKDFNVRDFDSLSLIFIIYFIVECIGLVYTEKANLHIGLFTLEKHQALIFLPVIFFDYQSNERHRKILFSTFVVSCYIATVICIIGGVRSSLLLHGVYFYDWELTHDRLSNWIGLQAVYFAMYLCFSVLIIFNTLIDKKTYLSVFKKALLILLILHFLVVIVSLGARTITVVFIVVIIGNIAVHAFYRKSYSLLIAAAIIPTIISVVIYLNPILMMRFTDLKFSDYQTSNYGSYFARLNIWEPGLEAIRENIWIGVGTGDHQTELDKKYIKFNYPEGVENAFNMHNQYLQTLLNFGIIGFIVFLTIFLIQLKSAIVLRDLLYLSFLLLFMGGCLTETMLSKNKGIIFLIVFSLIFYKSKK